MKFILFLILILILSCAEKGQECLPVSEVIKEYEFRKIPTDFRIYGVFLYGPLKSPMMLAKFDGFYTVRVAKTNKIKIEKNKLCIENKCYLLPIAPENLIFGRVLSGGEYHFCRNSLLMFRKKLGVYEKLVVFEGKKLKELIVRNIKKEKSIRIIFGDLKGKFFRELTFEIEGNKVKLVIEEVEI